MRSRAGGADGRSDEFQRCEDLILNSPVFNEAMAAFALPDGFGLVEPWPYGAAADEHPRRMQGLVYAKDLSAANDDANHYAFPIPIMPVIDWVSGDVVGIDRLATGGAGDGLGPQPVPPGAPVRLFPRPVPSEYVPELIGRPLRGDLKPLDVVQPEGASFAVAPDGLVEWQRWRFRVGFTPRGSAVLHDVCYDGRPVAYRLNYSEMTVPYADPRPPYQRKQAFDFGDGGVGRLANSLELGCDCLDAIHYLDALLAGPDGTPADARSVVCLHEQDASVLWKHTNYRTDRAVMTRARELVVQFVATMANYEYILAFKLDLAGALTLETHATGIVSVVAIDDGKRSDYGNVIAPGVLAQIHQHIFAVRVDPAIDSYRPGCTRVIVEESPPTDPDPATNPHGNLYHVRRSAMPRAATACCASRAPSARTPCLAATSATTSSPQPRRPCWPPRTTCRPAAPPSLATTPGSRASATASSLPPASLPTRARARRAASATWSSRGTGSPTPAGPTRRGRAAPSGSCTA